jgi:hypothetical protein
MLTIGEHREAIDRKCMFLILNAVVLCEIRLVNFMVTHWVVSPIQSTDKLILVYRA